MIMCLAWSQAIESPSREACVTTVRPGGGGVMAAATYSGRLTAVRVDDQGRFGESRSLPVGGLVRSLAASQDGSTLYFAGRCGVRALDLDAWLGPAAR